MSREALRNLGRASGLLGLGAVVFGINASLYNGILTLFVKFPLITIS
jgi:hypothetical protein